MARRNIPSLILVAALAALAACGGSRQPATTTLPVFDDVTPEIYMTPMLGPAHDWGLVPRVAEDLHRYDIAASAEALYGNSHVLYSLAEAVEVDAETVDVVFHWDLLAPNGELIGTTNHIARMPRTDWDTAPENLEDLARVAAARISAIVPGGRFNFVDPQVRIAARERQQELDERRRLYRKIASRGGMGPLSQRLFARAEQAETEDEIAVLETAAVETPPSAPPSPSGAFGQNWAQLAAFRTEQEARAYWDRVSRLHDDLLGDRRAIFPRADLGNRGVFYRVHAGPFLLADSAARFCADAKAVALSCFVATSDGPATAEAPAGATTPSAEDREGMLGSLGILALPAQSD